MTRLQSTEQNDSKPVYLVLFDWNFIGIGMKGSTDDWKWMGLDDLDDLDESMDVCWMNGGRARKAVTHDGL